MKIEADVLFASLNAIRVFILDIRVYAILQPNSCQYVKPDRRGKKTVNSQEIFVEEACEKYEKVLPVQQENSRRFVPVMSSVVPEDAVKLPKKKKGKK